MSFDIFLLQSFFFLLLCSSTLSLVLLGNSLSSFKYRGMFDATYFQDVVTISLIFYCFICYFLHFFPPLLITHMPKVTHIRCLSLLRFTFFFVYKYDLLCLYTARLMAYWCEILFEFIYIFFIVIICKITKKIKNKCELKWA